MNKFYLIFLFILFISVTVWLSNHDSEFIGIFLLNYPGIDKILHFLGYLFITWIFLKVLIHVRIDINSIIRRLFLGGGLFLISVVAELLQLHMLNRSFELLDILANVCGITLAFFFIDWKRIGWKYKYTSLAGILAVVAFLSILSYNYMNFYRKGLNYQRAGRYDLAKQEYITAIDKGIQNPAIYNELAWILTEFLKDDPVTAAKYASLALSKQPDNPDYLDTYGWSLYYMEKPADALKYLQKAYVLNPDIFCINYHLGATYLKLGQTEKARYHLAKQIERNSQDRDGLKSSELLEIIRQQ